MADHPSLDVLGVGCNSVDYVYRLPAAPRANSPTAKVRIRSHTVFCGGQTATTMVACAALGLRSGYLGAVGDDENGRRLHGELQRLGVDVSHVLTRHCPNRFAVITVDNDSGERVVLWDRDDRLNLAANEIAPGVIAAARLVHVDDEDQDAAIAAASIARNARVPVTSDIERMTARTAELVSAVSIPIFNEHVLPDLTGERDSETALRKLRKSHAGLLCVTLGANGAMLLAGDELIHDEGFEIEAVDTTAAGDVFRAAFIHALLKGATPRTMLRFANAAAAVSCTRAGAMTSVPNLDDVYAVLEQSS